VAGKNDRLTFTLAEQSAFYTSVQQRVFYHADFMGILSSASA
jgi:hypothetical protein